MRFSSPWHWNLNLKRPNTWSENTKLQAATCLENMKTCFQNREGAQHSTSDGSLCTEIAHVAATNFLLMHFWSWSMPCAYMVLYVPQLFIVQNKLIVSTHIKPPPIWSHNVIGAKLVWLKPVWKFIVFGGLNTRIVLLGRCSLDHFIKNFFWNFQKCRAVFVTFWYINKC